MEELNRIDKSLEDKTARKNDYSDSDIPDNLSSEAVERIKKSRFIKICVFIGIDTILAAFLIYQVVTVFKTIIENFPH